jgi:ABC-type transport system involved in cytochrome c biogenesis ATPase subunit
MSASEAKPIGDRTDAGDELQIIYRSPFGSISSQITDTTVSDFIVLSGPNGTGKSNLLEGIANGALQVAELPQPLPPQAVRLFRLAQLVAQIDGPQSPVAFRDRHLQLHAQVQAYATQFRQPGSGIDPTQVEASVRNAVLNQRLISQRSLDRLLAGSGKDLVDMEVADYRLYAPLLVGIRDPFALSVTELFLSYHDRWNRNAFEQWLAAEKQDTGASPVTDEAFVRLYGPPPWKMLDETLAIIGLDYSFVPPKGLEESLPYEAELLHRQTGERIKANLLSAGEKTLLAIALSMYSGSRMGEAMELPLILLLDEADASLHPSMVRSLLQVAHDVFYKQYGVKVILTTHSPSTVALAPEESLFVMRRNGFPRLVKASRDEALSTLTVGLPTLSVRLEDRRQVFVESEYDEACYQQLFQLLRPSLNSPFSLTFIASGHGGQGNSIAVEHLVSTLRRAGNTSVLGIVDHDSRVTAPDGVIFDDEHYSIENLILDPLAVGVYLLRAGKLTAKELGLSDGLRHFQLTETEAQTLSDAIVARVVKTSDDQTSTTVDYQGSGGVPFTVSRPAFWSAMRGHDLDDRLRERFPFLQAARQHLLEKVVIEALADVPRYIPAAAARLFASLLEYPPSSFEREGVRGDNGSTHSEG